MAGSRRPRWRQDFGACLVRDYTCQRPHRSAVVFYLWNGEPGYCWLFPTGQGYRLGAGFLGSAAKSTRRHLDSMEQFCQASGLLPGERRLHRISGALAPVRLPATIAAQRVLLVGDAAGLLDPLSGEGIYNAMRSGQAAGLVLGQGLDRPARRYLRAIRPLLREVGPPGASHPGLMVAALKAYFGLVPGLDRLGLGGLARRPFVNRLFRRGSLPPGSHYRRLH